MNPAKPLLVLLIIALGFAGWWYVSKRSLDAENTGFAASESTLKSIRGRTPNQVCDTQELCQCNRACAFITDPFGMTTCTSPNAACTQGLVEGNYNNKRCIDGSGNCFGNQINDDCFASTFRCVDTATGCKCQNGYAVIRLCYRFTC